MEVYEKKYYIDGNDIMLAEVVYDEDAENPCKTDDGYGDVYVLDNHLVGNLDINADDLSEAAAKIPEMGDDVIKHLSDDCDCIDIDKCHKKEIAVVPFRYVENNHGPGTSSVRECDIKDANGFIFASKEKWNEEWGVKSLEHVENSFRKCLPVLEDWCNGNVYGLLVRKIVKDGTPYDRMNMEVAKSGELVYSDVEENSFSCYGYYEDHSDRRSVFNQVFEQEFGNKSYPLYDTLKEAEAALSKEKGKDR